MKEVVLRMEDSDYQKFMGMVSLCPTVKVVYDGNCDDGRDIEDKCFAMAIIELRKSNAFKTPGDYAYVMKAVNEGVISISTLFTSPKKFISYMYVLGLDNLPGRNTIYDALNKTSGKYPSWNFSDTKDHFESIRRRNVAIQFKSAFYRAHRQLSDGISDK